MNSDAEKCSEEPKNCFAFQIMGRINFWVRLNSVKTRKSGSVDPFHIQRGPGDLLDNCPQRRLVKIK